MKKYSNICTVHNVGGLVWTKSDAIQGPNHAITLKTAKCMFKERFRELLSRHVMLQV